MKKFYRSIEEVSKYLEMKGIKNYNKAAKSIMLGKKEIDRDTLNWMASALSDYGSNEENSVRETSIMRASAPVYNNNTLEYLEQRFKNLRRNIFGSEDIPFPNYDEAIIWIEKESEKYYLNSNQEKVHLFEQKFNEIKTMLISGEALGYIDIPLNDLMYKPANIEKYKDAYADDFDFSKTKFFTSIPIVHSQALRLLQRETSHISAATGIAQYDLVRLALSGIRPEITLYEVIEKKWEPLTSKITININTPNVTFDTFREIYKEYRNSFNIKHKKSLSENQLRIIELINEIGPPPEGKGTTAYYTALWKEWNTRHPGKQYANWGVLYKKYQEIKKKINR